MAKQAAPVSLTGGAGFGFEDQVAARFLTDMLGGLRTFGDDFGPVVRLDWQARDMGRLLDDLVVTTANGSGRHVAEVSAKRGRQVTSGGFPADFVTAAWEQWLSVGTERFDRDKDLLVLATGELADDVEKAWRTLLSQARATTPDRLLARLDPANGSQLSETARALFASLKCPSGLANSAGGSVTDATTVELVRRVRLLHFDFPDEPSLDWERIRADCRVVLRSDQAAEAAELRKDLTSFAKEQRQEGGSADLPAVLGELRGCHEFRDHPDYRSDWEVIGGLTRRFLDETRDEVGPGRRIDRADRVEEVRGRLEEARVCLMAGESGCGKSALAKALVSGGYDAAAVLASEGLGAAGNPQGLSVPGLTHPLRETLESAAGTCLVVVDSLERHTRKVLTRLGRLIAEVRGSETAAHVHVLLVCQFEAARRVIDGLAEGGLDRGLLQVLPINGPADDQVRDVLEGLPGSQWQTLRLDLRPLLRNLKVLDWVVRATGAGHNFGEVPVGGLIPVIDYLWERWLEAAENSVAGGGLLKTIAAAEADEFLASVPLTRLEYAEQQAIPGLVDAGLLCPRDERIAFSHDLLGDWARLKVLVGEDPTRNASGLKRVASARWHRAVRLYGRWLLSRPDGTERWTAAVERAEAGGDDGVVVRDLLLDALIVSENSRDLLSAAWPALTTDGGRLLGLLMHRFLFVATLPDLRLAQLAGVEELTPQLAVAFRIPVGPYWLSLLSVLDDHRDEVCRLVPGGIATVCQTWLKVSLPVAGHVPGDEIARPAAARLALAAARELQARDAEGHHGREEHERSAYEAALLAAPELPGEVAAFALELAGRRPVSPEVQARAEAAATARGEQRQRRLAELGDVETTPGGSYIPRGRLRKPWPDGPQRRVDRHFREIVQGGTSILPLARTRPDEVLELLLAVCIEPPRHDDPFGSESDSCALESERVLYPPMYFRGPFLGLFREAPDLALTFTLRLVNFASKRWREEEELYRRRRGPIPADWNWADEQDRPLSAMVPLEGSPREWVGERRVFRWHLDWSRAPKLVTCVLMALEKWLYEKLDADEEVRPHLDRIMRESHSVAFAGLLAHVGKKKPELFADALRPLIGVAEIHKWDFAAIVDRSGISAGMIGWWGEPSALVELAREWHAMPHRAFELRLIAAWLTLHDPDTGNYLDEHRARWVREAGGTDAPLDVRMLAAYLDRANYVETKLDDGSVRSEFVYPPELAGPAAARNTETGDEMNLIAFPIRCRQILDREADLPEEGCEAFLEFAKDLQRRESPDVSDQRRRADALAGSAAVLLTVHPRWTGADPDRRSWCLLTLEGLAKHRSARDLLDVPESAGSWHWECFVGETGVFLLCEDAADPLARRLVAAGITAYHYEATRRTVMSAFRRRGELADEFEAMIRLSVHWAVFRTAFSRIDTHPDVVVSRREDVPDEDGSEVVLQRLEGQWNALSEQFDEVLDGFLRGNLPAPTLAEAEALGRDFVARIDAVGATDSLEGGIRRRAAQVSRRGQRLRRGQLHLNVHSLMATFSWLDEAIAAGSSERRELQSLIAGFRDLVLSTLPDAYEDDVEEVDCLPDDFDHWVFGRLSRYVAGATASEDPAVLWKPLLGSGPPGDRWVNRFFWEWFSQGFNGAPDHGTFATRWGEMIEFALTSEQWDPATHTRFDFRRRVLGLLGLELNVNAAAANPQFAVAAAMLRPRVEAVAKRWFGLHGVASQFARALSLPGYGSLLRDGIRSLHAAARSVDPYYFWDWQMESHLIDALHLCWERHTDDVLADDDLRTAFSELLTTLTSRGKHEAMALRDNFLNSLAERA